MTKIVDSILGFALGDAMGVFCKNRKREDLIAKPVVKMEGFGAFGVPSGVWSDDTALVLATIDSLVCTHKIDYDDMMRRFYNWMNKGEYTATGIVFDVEDVTRDSLLKHFTRKADVFNCGDKVSNSNGSLKRILPIALYTFYDDMSDDDLRGKGIAGELVKRAFDYFEKSGYKVKCSCSYAKNWGLNHGKL